MMRTCPKSLLVFLFLAISLGNLNDSWALTNIEAIQIELKHANTYYWLGMEEKGNLDAFRHGISHLDQAAKLLTSSSIPLVEGARLQHEIEILRKDLTKQIQIHQKRFYAVFPLVRLLLPAHSQSVNASSTFEILSNPEERAVNLAGEALRDEVVKTWTARPQLDTIITTFPSNTTNEILENKLAYVFNASSKFFLHNNWELAKILTTQQLADLQSGNLSLEIKQKLFEKFKIPDMLLVSVSSQDKVDKNHFYLVEGRIYNLTQNGPLFTFSKKGLVRDRQQEVGPIILANLLLLLSAWAFYCLLVGLRRHDWQFLSSISTWIFPVVGFMLGWLMPWVMIPMLASIAPSPNSLAIRSFWWPCLVGLTLFSGPVLFFRMVAGPLNTSGFNQPRHILGGDFCITIALGVTAYLAGPILLYLQGSTIQAILIITGLVLCSCMALYLLGRCFDTICPLKLSVALIPCFITFILGGVILHLAVTYLWIMTILTGIIVMLVDYGTMLKGKHPEISDKTIPEDINELIKRLAKPTFQRSDFYLKHLQEKLKPFGTGKTMWLELVGPDGAGKTATADALILDLSKQEEKLIQLRGDCSPESRGATAYAPFRMAFARNGASNLQFEAALDDLFKAAIPTLSRIPTLCSPINPTQLQKDFFNLVAGNIRKIAQQAPIILFLDNIHWIDQSSRELLIYLLDQFPAGGEFPLLVLLTARKADFISNNIQNVEIDIPGKEQRVQILVHSLGFRPDVAAEIVTRVGSVPGKSGELFYLFQVMANMARKGFFFRADNGFIWSETYRKTHRLPIPATIFEALTETWNQNPEYRHILVGAACLGREFKVHILAECLGIDRLTLLHKLTDIEEKTGIIHDACLDDDVYTFSSGIWLEEIQTKLRIDEEEPKGKNNPQLVREYHARAATALEKTLPDSAGKIYEIANHYYGAGSAYAEKAMWSCLHATSTARQGFDFDMATQFLDMAKECAEIIGESLPLEEEERLLINCDKVHGKGIEGPQRLEIAKKCEGYLNRHPSPGWNILAAFARTFYEAGRDDRRFYALAGQVGRMMAERANSPSEKAEGLHFIALSSSQAQEKEKYLKEAFELLNTSPQDELAAQALLSRVANSLAEMWTESLEKQWNQITADLRLEERQKIIDLFMLSKKIKSRPELSDKTGLAYTCGGLGRLYRYCLLEPDDINRARDNFTEDLKLSQELGDVAGQCQMYSHLGSCNLLDEKYPEALKNYEESYKLAHNLTSKFFALTGILEAACGMGDSSKVVTTSTELQEAAKLILAEKNGVIPADCAQSINMTLASCDRYKNEDWCQELLRTIQPPAEEEKDKK